MEILALALVVVVVIACASAQTSRGHRMLEDWAAREGVVLVSAEQCWFTSGPFWWRKGASQVVYRITVEDDAGRTHDGYARCGGMFLGMWSDQVTVEWD